MEALDLLERSAEGFVLSFLMDVLVNGASWSLLNSLPYWLILRLRSFSVALCLIMSVEWFHLKSGAESSSIL